MAASHESPPKELDRPIEVSPGDWSDRDFYLMLTGLVIPRPIGWISSISPDGVRNLAPYSYFNLLGSDPFYCGFASDGVKDSLTNVRATGEFVANIVTMDLLEHMNFTATNFPSQEDEYTWAGLTPVPSAKVKPPRVKEAKAHLECKVVQIIDDHNTHIVLGKIVHAHVDPSVWKAGRVDPRLLDPVCRLSGSAYGRLGDLFNVPRPQWKDVESSRGKAELPRAVKKS
jgi:flavin reductase (DIM6/NTAB) family NADH-FMN oxidoreductase RutF